MPSNTAPVLVFPKKFIVAPLVMLKGPRYFEQSKETVSTQNGFYLTVSKIKLAFSPFYGKLALEKRFASMLFKHDCLHYFHK